MVATTLLRRSYLKKSIYVLPFVNRYDVIFVIFPISYLKKVTNDSFLYDCIMKYL